MWPLITCYSFLYEKEAPTVAIPVKGLTFQPVHEGDLSYRIYKHGGQVVKLYKKADETFEHNHELLLALNMS